MDGKRVDSSFEDAQKRFQEFLVRNGYPKELTWVTPDDVILRDRKLVYVRLPVPASNTLHARELFELGMLRQLGVLLQAVCEIDGTTCCYVWVPVDQAESQYALMPRGLKMSANMAESRIPARSVRSRIQWHWLRKKQAMKDGLFGWYGLGARANS
jgi:hypothetical protein